MAIVIRVISNSLSFSISLFLSIVARSGLNCSSAAAQAGINFAKPSQNSRFRERTTRQAKQHLDSTVSALQAAIRIVANTQHDTQ